MSCSTNAQFYLPFDTWKKSTMAWMAVNDINILSVTDDSIIYEYAFLRDGRKWWAKMVKERRIGADGAPLFPVHLQLVEIIHDVEATREVIDDAPTR